MVVITGENPPASSLQQYSDGDGISNSVIIRDNTLKVCSCDSPLLVVASQIPFAYVAKIHHLNSLTVTSRSFLADKADKHSVEVVLHWGLQELPACQDQKKTC